MWGLLVSKNRDLLGHEVQLCGVIVQNAGRECRLCNANSIVFVVRVPYAGTTDDFFHSSMLKWILTLLRYEKIGLAID